MLHYTFSLRYRAQVNTDGPMGHNWDHNYFERLKIESDGSVVHQNGLQRNDLYLRNNVGEFVSPPEFYTRLTKTPSGTFTLRFRGGVVKTYSASGKLQEIRDRHDNFMTFQYDAQNRLSTVTDTMGRKIEYHYDANNRLQDVEDFAGRKVKFEYDGRGDLIRITSPAVTGTPNGNDFPNGKTTEYTYSFGFNDARLNHNLLTITRPNEEAVGGPPVLINEYDSSDRVIRQTSGGTNASGVPAGGTFTYTYTQLNAGVQSDDPNLPVTRVRETDRNGNVTEYDYNRLGYPTLSREFTRGFRTGDPSFYRTEMLYNADGRLIQTTRPEGNITRYTYDEGNSLRHAQANLTREERTPDARGGDQTFIRTETVYEPVYQQPFKTTDSRGLDPAFVPPIPDPAARPPRDRYTTTYTYDYQEGTNFAGLGAILGISPAEMAARLAAAGMPMGLGDVNGDGNTSQIAGRVIRQEQPSVVLLAGSNQAAIEGDRLQDIVTVYRYNSLGQMTAMVDPEANVHTYDYFPETDPDGDGTNTPAPPDGRVLDPTTGGYLKEEIRDTQSNAVRDNKTDPTPVNIRTQYTYDAVGNRITMADGRGIRTDYFVNQLNQVVEVTRAAAVPTMGSGTPPEPITLTPFAYRDRTFYDFNDNVVQRQTEDRGDTSNTGGFVDTTYQYDILDNQVRMTQEVDVTTNLVTRYRYDANENRVLTIHPEGNADSAVYDERDLMFQSTRGAATRPSAGLYAPGDPTTFNRPGGAGTQPSTTIYSYDRNANLVETVDAEDNGGTKSTFKPFNPAVTPDGDATRYQYDGFDRRRTVTDPLGNRMIYTYDPLSNAVRTRQDGDADNDIAGDTENKTLSVTEYVYDELSRVVVTHRILFQTPDVTPQRTSTLTDTPAMDTLADYLDDANSDTAAVPSAVGISVIGRVSTITEYDRSSRTTFTVQDDLDTYRTDYDGADRAIKTVDSALNNGFSGGAFNPNNISGNTVCTEYDDNSNVIERLETDVTDVSGVTSEGFRTTYLYDALDRLQTTFDNRGQAEDYRYDSRSNLVARADAVGTNPTARSFNRRGCGSMAAVSVNNFGNVTRTRYDGINRTLETEAILTASGRGDGTHIGATLEGVLDTTPTPDPNQSVDGLISVYYAYDDNSQLLALRDDDGNTTEYVYDNQNRTVKEIKGLYVPGTTFTVPGGDSGAFNVNLRGGVTPEDCHPTGSTITNAYDRDSNLTPMIDEAGNNFAYTYDALNRRKTLNITRAADFVGTTQQTWEYDGMSRLTRCTDNNEPAPTTDDVTDRYFYDSLSRKVEEQQQIGAAGTFKATTCNFEISGTSSATGGGAVDQPSACTYPDNRRVNTFYDALDRLAAKRDNGQGSDIGQVKYIGAWRVALLTYQNNTRLTHLRGTTDVGFDNLRRIVNHRWEQFTAGDMSFGDDALLVGFEHQDGNVIPTPLYDRANNKQIEFKTHDSNNSEQYKYDSVYRLASTGSGAQGLNARGFERGTFANNNRDSMSSTVFHQDWDLEGVGNWTRLDDNAAVETRKHSDINELVGRTRAGQDGGVDCPSFDLNGNMLNTGFRTNGGQMFPDGGLRIQYDALNRVRRVLDNNNTPGNPADDTVKGTYTYDCQNRRMRKVANSDTTDFYYDGWRVVEERDGSDAVTQQYTYGNYLDEVWTLDNRRSGITVAQLNDGAGNQRHFYHSNTLYHVYALTDETGMTKEGYQYDAYGKHTLVEPGGNGVFDTVGGQPDWGAIDDTFTVGKPSQLNNPYTYTGQRLDPESGLMYYKNRYHGTELGRFVSRDPIGYNAPKGHTTKELSRVDTHMRRLNEPAVDYLTLFPIPSQWEYSIAVDYLKSFRGLSFGICRGCNLVLRKGDINLKSLNLSEYVQGKVTLYVDPYGLLPQACYRPAEELGNDYLGNFALIWHAFIKFPDGATYSVTGPEGDEKPNTYCYEGERQDTCECRGWTDQQIEDCLREFARGWETEEYGIFTNNCGQWVRTGFKKCCLKSPTPWWLFYF